MVNINGEIYPNDDAFISIFNTSLISGDLIFENLIVSSNKVLFYEEHYFNLLSSMRILKIKIPMSFTPEFLEEQLLSLYIKSGFVNEKILMRILICNNVASNINPTSVNYYIYDAHKIDYSINNFEKYTLDVFKDYFKNTGLLSNLTTNNQLIQRIGLRYCEENDFNDCVILNNSKTISESLKGKLNIFEISSSNFKVDFGDGQTQLVSPGTLVHQYATPGTNEYTITVTANGTGGAVSTFSKK